MSFFGGSKAVSSTHVEDNRNANESEGGVVLQHAAGATVTVTDGGIADRAFTFAEDVFKKSSSIVSNSLNQSLSTAQQAMTEAVNNTKDANYETINKLIMGACAVAGIYFIAKVWK